METKIIGNELYVYFQGACIYKRWLDHDYGKVFHENEGLTQKAYEREKNKTTIAYIK